MNNTTRRDFLKYSAATLALAGIGTTARTYGETIGANSRVRVGVVGFSDRFQASLLPSFLKHAGELNFDIVAVADLWSKRREQGQAVLSKAFGHNIIACRNTEELYSTVKDLDAVIISTPDFSHALITAEAALAGKDIYAEKPLAETMADNRVVLKAVRDSKRIVQIGSQRRSGRNYIAAAEFIQQGRFGPIVSVELVWNVNQPGRWRRPALVKQLREEDIDWKRFLLNRPEESYDPRKYLEYRLFWPYSSGIPGQWMCHQIDTVHWFSGFHYPRSVVANGGIYVWKDGRRNADTLTAVLDYGPKDPASGGFQVIFSSRMTNSVGGTKEVYYSNGGALNLDTGMVSAKGGLTAEFAKEMEMKPNLLKEEKLSETIKVESGSNTGMDPLTSMHMRNWMECVHSRREPHAPIEAGYRHSIASIMTNAAYRTGKRIVFDEARQEVLAGGDVFQY